MKNNSKIALCFGLLSMIWLLGSCDDFIAKDITDDVPVIILPQNGSTVAESPVQMKWEAVDGATKYRIQVVSPSFSNIQIYAMDSIVSGTNFYAALDSNNYEMRITATNAGYESAPSAIVAFSVGSNSSGGGGTIILSSPANGVYLNEGDVTFNWNAHPGVLNYTFELHNGPTFASPLNENSADQLGVISLTASGLTEGTYSWGVKAYLSNGNETPFTKRTFYIDATPPGITTLISPADGTTEPVGSVTFNWQVDAAGTNPSSVTSIFELSTDVGFSQIINTQSTTGLSVTVPNLVFDTYFWRVRTVDAAGNTGPTSQIFDFNAF